MRRALTLHPEPFVEANRVDDQRVPFPVTDRVSVVTGREVFGMRPTIHVDDMERLRAGLVDDVDSREIRQIHELDAARRDELPRPSGGLAASVGLEQIGFAIVVQSSGPRLKRNLALFRFPGERRSGESAAALAVFDRGIGFRFGQNRTAIRLPDPLFPYSCAEPNPAVRPARSRSRGCLLRHGRDQRSRRPLLLPKRRVRQRRQQQGGRCYQRATSRCDHNLRYGSC